MTKFQKTFDLNIRDLDIIETALRTQAELESRLNGAGEAEFIRATAPKTKQIHDLLGKLHQQKLFYANVQENFCPAG